MSRDFYRRGRRLAAHTGRILLVLSFTLLIMASGLDFLQLQSPAEHYYFYASRWMGTGLTLGLLACAGFWMSPKFDAIEGDESAGHPTLATWLVLVFYAASWAVRKHQDRHLTELAALLSFAGLAGLLALACTALRRSFKAS